MLYLRKCFPENRNYWFSKFCYMKRILITIPCVLALMLSCTKEDLEIRHTDNDFSGQQIQMTEAEAQQEFAVALSKAVAENEQLRTFIRDEALSQFDKDYDVFYPFVKNQTVSDGLTFRDILLKYCEQGKLEQIETTLPLLNILVPDWSWIDGFTVTEWDTADSQVAVGYDDKADAHQLYYNGQELFKVQRGEFPNFPVLLVKNNERLEVTSPATKSCDATYRFIDDAFDGSLQVPETKVHHQYYDRNFSVETPDYFMPSSNLDPLVIGAYNEFKNNPAAAHRDYIYYGMTNTVTEGVRNVHVKEVLHKLKFRTAEDDALYDSPNNDFIEHYGSMETKKYDFSDADIMDHGWIDGSIELQLDFIIPSNPEMGLSWAKRIPIVFRDAFTLSKAHVDYRHKTGFTRDWWVYSVDGKDHFSPKWIYVDIPIDYMDISTRSAVMYIMLHEIDTGNDYTYHTTVVAKYVDNFNLNLDGTATVDGEIVSGTIKLGLGYGTSSERETTVEVTCNVNDASDFLGSAKIEYIDPIIKSSSEQNGVQGYIVNGITTGTVDMMVLPMSF